MMIFSHISGYIFIAGGIQGLLLALYLLTRRKQTGDSNIILALVVFAVAVDLCTALVPVQNATVQISPALILLGPLMYLYVQTLFKDTARLNRKLLYGILPLYGIPLCLFLLNTVMQFGAMPPGMDAPVTVNSGGPGAGLFQLTPVSLVLFAGSTVVFLLLSIKELKVVSTAAALSRSDSAIVGYAALRLALQAAVLLFIMVIVLFILSRSRYISIGTAYGLLRWTIVIGIYWLSYAELQKSSVKGSEPEVPDTVPDAQGEPVTDTAGNTAAIGDALHRRDAVHKENLLELMQRDKPYLQSELNLHMLAGMMQMHPRTLSRVINTTLGGNFFDFINRYRVAEAKRLLADRHALDKNIIMIAYECGFNTKSSFNALFRKYEQMTPTEYRKRQLAVLPEDMK